ncbi:probable disease resistance protein At1g61300 [Henckelia pumila]|uniref:probable disease resistance protein At1g61300 n=1 Tax=Henckelia pumila TaxID=405737 RepID=UPI003C6E5423
MAEMLSNMVEKLANLGAEKIRDSYGTEGKMRILESEIQALGNRAADVRTMLREEEVHTGRKRKREVKDWLEKVDVKKTELDNLNQQLQQTRFYNFNSRLHLGSLMKEMKLEVDKLVECGKFAEGFFLEVCKTKGRPLVTTKCRGQRALEQNLKTVWTWLMNDGALRIGIYGMGGVGKTTLAMHIHDKLLSDPTFNCYVYWIDVSQDSSIHKLQNDIAHVLNLDLSNENNENHRAARLFEALKRRNRFVLILDDVWKNFEIEKIGIPLGTNGSKLLITSRSVDVCNRMGCEKNIKVDVLCEVEAWELFLNKLGSGTKLSHETEKVAKDVAKMCAGLPLGITTIGGSMRGLTDIHEWRDALEELKESSMGTDDMETEVFPVLFCSFNRLRDPKLQRCFLYCSLYPEGYRIPREELIAKFISEDLMDKRKSRQANFDQGHSVLNKLENASLLERTDYGRVKIHDLIRDMALRVTSSDPKFMVKAGLQLYGMPAEQDWQEDLDKISLMCNKISIIPPCFSPKCHKLSSLILRRNPLEVIPESFFLHMRGLRVLDLSYTWIQVLPNSVDELGNLNTLLLAHCLDLKYLPPLTKLVELKELDLNKNQIKELPPGMQNLINLKSLNLGDMSSLEMIPAGLFPKLSLLERLIVPDHLQVRGEEMEWLKKLEEFQGSFCDVHDLNKFIISQQRHGKLSFYNISVGKSDSGSLVQSNKKILSCKLLTLKGYCFTRERGRADKVLLPQNIQQLVISKCVGLNSSLSDIFPSLNYLTSLKILRLGRCEVTCISRYNPSDPMKGEQMPCCIPFRSLERLILYMLPDLTSLIKCDVAVTAAPLYGTFCCLKELHIKFCNKIRKLFTLRLLHNLSNLEEIHISECAELEEIIETDEDNNSESTSISPCSMLYSSSHEDRAIITLTKLRRISLKWLPQLKSICRETILCDSIENIVLLQCYKLKMLPFYVLHPPSLEQIWIGKEDQGWWDSIECSHPNAKDIFQPYVKRLGVWLQTSTAKPSLKAMVFAVMFIKRLQYCQGF